MNDQNTINDLLSGNLTIWIDIEYATIFKLMAGLILTIVISSIISNALVK